MINLNYLTDRVLYQILHIIYYFEYIIKKHDTLTDDPPIKIFVNKIEYRITFKIKKGYYLEILTSEMTELHGITKMKITKDENGKNESH